MKGSTILACILAMLLSSCATKYEVFKVSDVAKESKHGVIYALPKTVVAVEIPIKKTAFKPGVYSKYSREFLGIQSKSAKGVTYSIGEPSISTRAIADSKESYLLKLKGSWHENREVETKLNRLGILTSATTSVENKGPELAISILKTSADIIARSALPLPVSPEGLGARQTMSSDSLANVNQQENENREIEIRAVLAEMDDGRVALVKKTGLDQVLTGLKNVYGNGPVDAVMKKHMPKIQLVRCEDQSAGCVVVPSKLVSGLYGLINRVRGSDSDGKLKTSVSKLTPQQVKVSGTEILARLCRLGIDVGPIVVYPDRLAGSFRSGKTGNFLARSETCEHKLASCVQSQPQEVDETGDKTVDEENSKENKVGGQGLPGLCSRIAEVRGFIKPNNQLDPNKQKLKSLEDDFLTSCVKEERVKACPFSGQFASNQILLLNKFDTKRVYNLLRREQAQKLALRINELKERRNMLIAGNSNAVQLTGPALEAMIREIDEELQKMIAKFLGSSSKELTWPARFEISPDGDVQQELFSLSKQKGLVIASGSGLVNEGEGRRGGFLAGSDLSKSDKKKVEVAIKQVAGIVDKQTVQSPPPKNNPNSMQKKNERSSSEAGFRYRVPGNAKITVTSADEFSVTGGSSVWSNRPKDEIASASTLIAQFGVVRSLPQSSGSILKSVFNLELDAETGGITSVKVSGSALDPATIESFGGVVTGIQDRRLASRAAEDAKDAEEAAKKAAEEDRINILTRERDILALEREIEELQAPVPETGVEDDAS